MRAMSRKRWIAGVLVVALAAAGLLGYSLSRPRTEPLPAPAEEPWLADVTEAMGIDFTHDAGELNNYWLPRINGSGVAVFDCDGDGKLDLYFLNFGGPGSTSKNRLYRNLGGGKFQDVTAGSGLEIDGHNTGVIVGDVDNDGRPDVVVAQFNGIKLFRNLGGGRFADVTSASGLKNPLWGTSLNLFDYDRDGWLDLIVVNYIDYDPSRVCLDATGRPDYCGPHLFPYTVSKLFRNLGRTAEAPNQPKFQDVTVSARLATAPGPGLGVYCADFDGDGWQDIFIANDLKANHLWINQRDGTFKEEAILRGIGLDVMGLANSGMGVAVGDVDNDGLLDVYVTHLNGETNTLWMQGLKKGFFKDQTAKAGLLGTNWRGTGWGTVFVDFDRDGWQDLALVNGRVYRDSAGPAAALGPHFQNYGERNQLLRNDGTGRFRDISESNPAFCGERNVARGLACGDLDGDGTPDLVVTTIASKARVLRNIARGGHGLTVQAIDPRLNRDAYGAEIRVTAGDRTWLRVVNPGDSFQSCSDPRPHFGLGADARYDSIRVLWPDGAVESFPGGEADRIVVLKRGEGAVAAGGKP